MTNSSSDEPLSERAYRVLKQRIVDCEFKPGEWLTERQVASELGIGLSPVRAALTRLDHDGMITTSARRGYQVTPLTIKRIGDVFTAWGIIGPAIADLAASRVRDSEVEELRRLAATAARGAAPDATAAAGDSDPVLNASQQFFQRLVEIADNPILLDTFQRLDGDVRRAFIYVQLIAPSILQELDQGAAIEKLAAALADRDRAGARKIISDYISRVQDTMIDALRSSTSVMETHLQFTQ